MQQKYPFLIGAHLSIAGGLDKPFLQAQALGFSCLQIFTKSNRQWQAKPITPVDAQLFKTATQQTGIMPFAHASYLLNIGSPKEELRQKSIEALRIEVERCTQLAIPYLILHPGARDSSSIEECLATIAKSLDQVSSETEGSTMILVENTAGQGSAVGYELEHLGILHNLVKHKNRIGFCIDTCHALAAGYDLSNHKSYKKFWHTFDQHIGMEHLKAIHLNDSKKPLGSKVDRHEDVGKGKIGIEGFRLLINDPALSLIPKILETPEDEHGNHHYKENADTLESLIDRQ